MKKVKHSKENVDKAIELRKSGKSYRQIEKEMNISQSTLAHWFGKTNFSKEEKELLSKNNLSLKRKDNIEKYNLDSKECLFCYNKILYDHRENGLYCSRKCFLNDRNKKANGNKIKKEIVCLNCNMSIICKNKKFCSKKCKLGYGLSKDKQIALDTGILPGKQESAKKIILLLRGYECEICHIKEWQGKIVPLVMDHIDGNSTNNTLKNLRLVCGNCDMQLPTYKSKNKGKGRIYNKLYMRKVAAMVAK